MLILFMLTIIQAIEDITHDNKFKELHKFQLSEQDLESTNRLSTNPSSNNIASVRGYSLGPPTITDTPQYQQSPTKFFKHPQGPANIYKVLQS